MKYLLVILTLLPLTFSSGQTYTIRKILDTNLFLLEDGTRISMYGLNFPSKEDPNPKFSSMAQKIIQFEEIYLLRRTVKFTLVEKNKAGISVGKIYLVSNFSEYDVAQRFVNDGYATIKNDVDSEYFLSLVEKQQTAQSNETGVWAISQPPSENGLVRPIIMPMVPIARNVEHPYLGLLAVSAVSFVMAWDSFSAASDIDDLIQAYKRSGWRYDKTLDAQKKRKSLVGIGYLVAAVITTAFSLKSVEVTGMPQGVNVKYNF